MWCKWNSRVLMKRISHTFNRLTPTLNRWLNVQFSVFVSKLVPHFFIVRPMISVDRTIISLWVIWSQGMAHLKMQITVMVQSFLKRMSCVHPCGKNLANQNILQLVVLSMNSETITKCVTYTTIWVLFSHFCRASCVLDMAVFDNKVT